MEVVTTITGVGGFGDVSVEEFPVQADGALGSATHPPEFLLARGRSEQRVCPRFLASFAHPGTFAVEVRAVCPDARLEIRLDGKPARMVDLPAQDVPGKTSVLDPTYQLWVCEYQESYAIDLPPGRHGIQVENTDPGASWVQVRGYRFTRQEPVALRAIGLTGRGAVLVWVQNRESMWTNWDRPLPQAITGAQLTIRGVPEGKLRLEWLDTWTGKAIRTGRVVSEGGVVVLDVPPLRRDLACRLLR